MKKIVKSILCFSLIFIMGCFGGKSFDLNENFRDIEITNSPDSSMLLFYLVLENKESEPIHVESITYSLYIDDKLCGKGSQKLSITVDPTQEKNINLPLWISFNTLDKVSRSVLENKLMSPTYTLMGEMILSGSDGEQVTHEFTVSDK